VSIRLVSLEEVKADRGITNSDFDEVLDQKIAEASRIYMNFMKYESIPAEWLSGSPLQLTTPDDVKGWVKWIVGEMVENREPSIANPIPEWMKRLLDRPPTIA
jgi:hypothetical protein